jgi:hypothetical protein
MDKNERGNEAKAGKPVLSVKFRLAPGRKRAQPRHMIVLPNNGFRIATLLLANRHAPHRVRQLRPAISSLPANIQQGCKL